MFNSLSYCKVLFKVHFKAVSFKAVIFKVHFKVAVGLKY